MPRHDDAVPIHDECARERDAEGSGASRHRGIQQSVLLDDGRPGIRYERERNSARRCKLLQHVQCVVADGNEAKPLIAERFLLPLQLDQLRLAVGLPIGRSEEDDHCTFGPEARLQGVCLTELINAAEVRQP